MLVPGRHKNLTQAQKKLKLGRADHQTFSERLLTPGDSDFGVKCCHHFSFLPFSRNPRNFRLRPLRDLRG
jgi:hypothetical protein